MATMMRANIPWPDGAVAYLRENWGSGKLVKGRKTTTDLAREITALFCKDGRIITKNAVVGMSHRLYLEQRGSAVVRPNGYQISVPKTIAARSRQQQHQKKALEDKIVRAALAAVVKPRPPYRLQVYRLALPAPPPQLLLPAPKPQLLLAAPMPIPVSKPKLQPKPKPKPRPAPVVDPVIAPVVPIIPPTPVPAQQPVVVTLRTEGLREPPPFVLRRSAPVVTLHHSTCQYPHGHPRTPGFRFCGEPTWSCDDPLRSAVYCRAHHKLTHMPIPNSYAA
jgi:hypothetical protein